MTLSEKLAQLGLKLPPAPMPVGAYVPIVRSGKLVYISGQLPMRDGQLIAKGRIPSAINIEDAKKAAAQCAINALAIVGEDIAGDISKIVRVIAIDVFVQSDDTFHDQAQVANGASELFHQVLGEAGRHSRASIGVNALPLDAAVEMKCVIELK